MDPLEYESFYDVDANSIVAMTTTIVHTYFYLGCMHKVAKPAPPLALAIILEAPLAQPVAPWDFPLSPLPDIEMESVPLGLHSVEILSQPTISAIELSSTATLVPKAASPPIP